MFNELALEAASRLRKGQQIAVHGRLRVRHAQGLPARPVPSTHLPSLALPSSIARVHTISRRIVSAMKFVLLVMMTSARGSLN